MNPETVCDHFSFLGRHPFVWYGRSDQSFCKSFIIRNAQILRTGSVQNSPAHGSALFSSPALVGQSAGIWRVVVGKVPAHLGSFRLNWPEQVPFSRSDRSNEK